MSIRYSHNGDDHDLAPGGYDAHVEIDGCEDDGRNHKNQLDNVLQRLEPRVEEG